MSSNLPALRDTDPKLILQRYLSDETTKEIAASYGVTRQALGQYLLKVAESEWKEAQVARALARKESAEDDLEDAEKTPDMLSLSRARERLKAAQWDLERVCRRIYGQDAPPQGVNAVQININLKRVGSEPQPVLSGEVDTNT
jgi:predicted DNA-binding protein YlxM (UPF0122 family)